MKPSHANSLWTCPECGRQFEREGQAHSCKFFPLEQHFVGKQAGKLLYDRLSRALEDKVGPFKIESLQCCIHLLSSFTFGAVKILRDKIRVEFALSRLLKSPRICKYTQMSAHRHLYHVDINAEEGIDEELLQWLREAYIKPDKKAA